MISFALSGTLAFYVLSLTESDMKRDMALATTPIMFSGGEIFKIGYNCSQKPGIVTCNGLWSCATKICEVSHVRDVSFAGFRPADPRDNCSDTEEASIQRLGQNSVYQELQQNINGIENLIWGYIVVLIIDWILFLFLELAECTKFLKKRVIIRRVVQGVLFLSIIATACVYFLYKFNSWNILINTGNFVQDELDLKKDTPPKFVVKASEKSEFLLKLIIWLELAAGIIEFFSFSIHTGMIEFLRYVYHTGSIHLHKMLNTPKPVSIQEEEKLLEEEQDYGTVQRGSEQSTVEEITSSDGKPPAEVIVSSTVDDHCPPRSVIEGNENQT